MAITPIYAAILTLLFVLLGARVILARNSSGITIGNTGDEQLLRRSRVQGNFAEYAPLASAAGVNLWMII